MTKEQMAAIENVKAAINKAEEVGVTFLFEAADGWLFGLNAEGFDGIASVKELTEEYGDAVEIVEIDWNRTECVYDPIFRDTNWGGELYLVKE